ncbi:hypothetical protein BBJ28_00012546 [Nothophytophthora sp. Chile5]|nr:hypothetical protein BBJ28_00012546 [Nothophytophthora sp. Chile5]
MKKPTQFSAKQASRLGQLGLRGFLLALVALGSLTLVLQASSLLVDDDIDGRTRLRRVITLGLAWRHPSVDKSSVSEFLADASAENSQEVPVDDRLHLSLLHEACVTDINAVVPWQFGSPIGGHQLSNGSADNPEELIHPGDPNLLQKLRQCPDVDIFLPLGLRGNGYCEDAVAYAKCTLSIFLLGGHSETDSLTRLSMFISFVVCIFAVLESRLLPVWVLEVKLFDPELNREVDYYDLCPKTPMIFFNHYWDDVPNSPRWPKDKPLYLMPNIEMIELTAEYYWRADVVLCKTHVCYDRVTRWYAQEGNPRNSQVFYTKHTSSDQAEFARRRLGDDAISPKDFSNIKFIHTAGTSIWKGTKELLDCWTSGSGLPPLDVYIDDSAFNFLFPASYQRRIDHSHSPLHIHRGMLEPLAFSKLTAEAAFFMCPSRSEGYGHYINQARASGGVIVTTDSHPMNELVTSSDMGVLMPTRHRHNRKMLLGGNFKGAHGLKDAVGLLASYNSRGICETVRDLVSSTTAEQRAAMGAKARRQYHEDTRYFAHAMQDLRELARREAAATA